jgi:hypothetical protein
MPLVKPRCPAGRQEGGLHSGLLLVQTEGKEAVRDRTTTWYFFEACAHVLV